MSAGYSIIKNNASTTVFFKIITIDVFFFMSLLLLKRFCNLSKHTQVLFRQI